MIGLRFTRLRVTKKAPSWHGRPYWHCRCDCGGRKIVREDSLRGGYIRSCGCLHKEYARSKKGFERTLPIMERFEARYIPEPNSGCWLWLGSMNWHTGYGRFYTNGDVITYAHKFSYQVHKGKIPRGKILRHTCDVKSCVNPDHLIPGTPQDNSDDAVARGLMPKGEKHGMAKLTADTVCAVYRASGSISEIARKHSISRMHVQRIKEKKVWRHLLCSL